jgi:hypothetical protein
MKEDEQDLEKDEETRRNRTMSQSVDSTHERIEEFKQKLRAFQTFKIHFHARCRILYSYVGHLSTVSSGQETFTNNIDRELHRQI